MREIIETYWNVNIKQYEDDYVIVLEIIETYWNVNTSYPPIVFLGTFRNNRNILECKCA